ncbi:MAG: DNA-binding protein [Coriobacteriia bacterium]|nr:DNA-binding protein [Coriobacteriia bacterium]
MANDEHVYLEQDETDPRDSVMLSTKEAAERLGVSTARIRQLIGNNQVSAQRCGKSWLIEQDSLDAYAASAKVGRPARDSARARVRAARKEPASYVLMNRHFEVAECAYDPLEGRFTKVRILDGSRVPFALLSYRAKDNLCAALNEWWGSRGIPDFRPDLEERLRELGLRSAFELPFASMGLSLSDLYWLRPTGSALTWDDVNFFRNDFDLGPVGEGGRPASSVGPWMNAVGLNNPDNTTDGQLRKRWLVDGEGQRVLVKGNSDGGRQVYNEVIATMLYRRLLPSWRYVEYRLRSWRGQDVCVCPNFLRDDEEFIPAWYVLRLNKKSNQHNAYRHYCETCDQLGVAGVEGQLMRMLVCDSLLANEDRHWGNFGIVRNVRTLEYRVAPIFDTGDSLWVRKPLRDLVAGDYSFETRPFSPNPRKQLDMVIDASWYNPAELDGFVEQVRGFLDKVIGGADPTDAVCRGLQERIDQVNAWARRQPQIRCTPEQAEKLEWVWL